MNTSKIIDTLDMYQCPLIYGLDSEGFPAFFIRTDPDLSNPREHLHYDSGSNKFLRVN